MPYKVVISPTAQRLLKLFTVINQNSLRAILIYQFFNTLYQYASVNSLYTQSMSVSSEETSINLIKSIS
jgi:hypothetical protein